MQRESGLSIIVLLLAVLFPCALAAAEPASPLPAVFYPPPLPHQPEGDYVWLDEQPPYDARLISQPGEQHEPFVYDETAINPVPRIPQAKDGPLQDVTFQATYIAPTDDADLGTTDLSLGTTVGLPFPTTDWPLLVTPYFQVKYVSGPDMPDLPPRLFTTFVQFRWLPKLNESLRLDLAVAPGVYSDFEQDDSDALRITGRSLAIYTWSEETLFVLGILYLDRPDLSLLPAGGVYWTPGDWRFELVFPQPRIAHRFAYYESPFLTEYWGYIKGEFGSDAWSIQRANGAQDLVVLRDLRVILGVERKVLGGIGSFAEVGLVFDREVEYFRSLTPDFEAGDTVLVRGGLRY